MGAQAPGLGLLWAASFSRERMSKRFLNINLSSNKGLFKHSLLKGVEGEKAVFPPKKWQ